MPSWGVHIALANKLNKKLNLGNDFIIGNILPDATNGFIVKNISNINSHSKTHYNFEGINKPPKINIDMFLKDYNTKLNNPLILGSLIHLITDNYFNEYTIKKHVSIIDGKRVVILNDGSILKDIVPWKLKQEDFGKFAEYFIYNKQLGNKINLTDETINLSKDLVYDINSKDLLLVVDKINSIIDKRVEKLKKYRMFTEDELLNLFDSCYNYCYDVINNLEKDNKIKNKRKKMNLC